MKLEDFTKEQLLDLIKSIQSKTKYGITWEQEFSHEKYTDLERAALPVLSEVIDKRVFTEKNGKLNYILEGDNYFILKILNYTHSEKIDVIYIDPPYNTGNDDFKYNDKFVKREDTFRHSQWLSFMNKRLRLARHLLKDSGVLIVSIDDNELCQLKLLLDEIYGEDNFVALLPTIMNLKGNQDQFAFAGTHEYTLVYSKNKTRAASENRFKNIQQELDAESSEWEEDDIGWWKKGAGLKMTGINAPRDKQPSLYFPVYVRKDGNEISVEKKKDWDEVLPLTDGKEMSWRWSKKKFEKDSQDVIVVGNSPNWTFYKKQRPEIGELPSKKPKSILYKPSYSTTNGATQIKNLFGEKVFEYPKPVDLIKDLLALTTDNDSIILDFFAGSGTTGEAVLKLNKETNGKRQFLLVTNNDSEICEKITYPRIRKTIEGYKNASGQEFSGTSGNVLYFKSQFVRKTLNSDDMKIRMSEYCADILKFKHETFDEIVNKSDIFSIFKNKTNVIGIYKGLDLQEIDEMCVEMMKYEDLQKIAYVFTFDNNQLNPLDFGNVKEIEFEAIPGSLISTLGDDNVN